MAWILQWILSKLGVDEVFHRFWWKKKEEKNNMDQIFQAGQFYNMLLLILKGRFRAVLRYHVPPTQVCPAYSFAAVKDLALRLNFGLRHLIKNWLLTNNCVLSD